MNHVTVNDVEKDRNLTLLLMLALNLFQKKIRDNYSKLYLQFNQNNEILHVWFSYLWALN